MASERGRFVYLVRVCVWLETEEIQIMGRFIQTTSRYYYAGK